MAGGAPVVKGALALLLMLVGSQVQADNRLLAGGQGSTTLVPFPSFDNPAANMDSALRPDFFAGKALAEQPWIKAPTATDARDGLGPLYNARACLACHIRGGRSRVPDNSGDALFTGPLVKFSLPLPDGAPMPTAGVVPEPVYGDQLQTQSIALAHQLRTHDPAAIAASGDVAPESYPTIQWQESRFRYPDGREVSLRQPRLEFANNGYGPLHADTLISLRNAPSIQGSGLLELIAQADLDALADPDDANGDGISGRSNQVWQPLQQRWVPGRFGLKANRPDLATTVAAAFANDVGISNPLFPDQPCTAAQTACLRQRNGNNADGFELPDNLLQLVTNFTRNLGVPLRRHPDAADVVAGEALFMASGCSLCHQPSFVTVASSEFPHLGGQTIWPYSDLLLHDMGPALADGRPDFYASGSEWRTPPLWGIGLSQKINGSSNFLHDGRARSLEEAVLWHGGEADAARQYFTALPEVKRQQLLEFVNSL